MIKINDGLREPPYIEHTQESEREATENFVEYVKYAQKLQTELGEGTIFIQDRLNEIGLELAGIEETRMDLTAKEHDLERQMEYLNTLRGLINKRREELNGEVTQARNSSIQEGS